MVSEPRNVARAALDAQISEEAFQAAVISYAALRGWTWHHTPDGASNARPPRGLDARVYRDACRGFPDLVFARVEPGSAQTRCVVAELKRERGRVSREQMEWLALLQQIAGIEVYLWRPSDMDAVMEVLR